MATVQSFIDSVLRLIGVLDAGETSSTTESNHALEALNQMLSSWSAAGIPVYQLTTETPISLTGAASYTISSRPAQIRSVQCISAGITQDVQPMTAEQWAGLRDSTLTGKFATAYLYDAGWPSATIKLWPIPATGGTLQLYTLRELAPFAGLGAAINLPPGYEQALRFSLALALAQEYGSEVTPGLAGQAQQAMQAIASLNAAVLGPPRNAAPGAPPPAAAAQ